MRLCLVSRRDSVVARFHFINVFAGWTNDLEDERKVPEAATIKEESDFQMPKTCFNPSTVVCPASPWRSSVGHVSPPRTESDGIGMDRV